MTMRNCVLFQTLDGNLSFRRNTQALPCGAQPVEYDDSNPAHRAVAAVAERWNWEWCGASYPDALPIDPATCERAAGVPTV